MMAVVLLVAFRAEPKIEISPTADRIRLSDRILVEISISGPAPIIVTPPANWLDDESMARWSVRPVGEPRIASDAGDERWTRTLELSPYAVGESVALGWSPVVVRSGDEVQDRTLALPKKSFVITVDVTLASEPRPLSGFLDAEAGNDDRRVNWPLGIAACVAITLVLAWLIGRRNRRALTRETISLIATDDHRAWLEQFAESTPRTDLTPGLWRKIDEFRFGNVDVAMDELAAFRRHVESLPPNQPLHQQPADNQGHDIR
jgi:hypothetical protein